MVSHCRWPGSARDPRGTRKRITLTSRLKRDLTAKNAKGTPSRKCYDLRWRCLHMRWSHIVLLVGVAVVLAFPQEPGKPAADLDFSNDPCGNPLVESQAWIGVAGKVLKVSDGNTLQIRVTDDQRILEVRIAGIVPVERGPIASKAGQHLAALALGKKVSVFVNPSKWSFPEKRPKRVVGEVFVEEGRSDNLALSLLSAGLVRFKAPPPYTVSRYHLCKYRRAEAEARDKKLASWQ